MNRRAFCIIAVACLFTIIASPAQAMHHARLGRFVQRDPIGQQISTPMPRVGTAGAPGASSGFIPRDRINPLLQYADGMSLYQYVKANPINRIDPQGTFTSFIDCCPCQIKALKADEKRAQQQIIQLQGSLQLAINADHGQYPWFTNFKLNKAKNILDKASRALKNGKVKCVDEDGPYASVWPWGSTVKVYKPYWKIHEKAQGATLVHEGTHMGSGLTDMAYFWQNRKAPHDVLFIGWDIIASTYDTWILGGFCVPGSKDAAGPGRACPKAVIVNVNRGGAECP